MSSYRLGWLIVCATVIVSSLLCLALVNPRPQTGPAGEDLSSTGRALPSFEFVERSGKSISNHDLADRVWIAAFVFSRCNSSCPRISAVMRDLQTKLRGSKVTLASVTVDPDYDKPEVLRKFAEIYGADPDRWLFLTGEKARVHPLIVEGFLQSLSEVKPEDRKPGIEDISHSDRLVLVGPGNQVLGSYHSSEPDAVGRLLSRAQSLDKMAGARKTGWVLNLPALNAILNASCTALLITGWISIRRGNQTKHVVSMVSAISVSALFLTSYLVYHFYVGSVPFKGIGAIRLLYLSVLLSHTVLAVAVVPLIATTVILAILGRFESHRRIARVTFPIWVYVSVTGVVVYLMLYQMPLASASLS